MMVILNSNSGSQEETRIVRETFAKHGLEPEVHLAENGDELRVLALRAAESAHETVVAGGGDGTLNTVAQAILPFDKRLGVLPLGTLNHFAKDLGLPLTIDGAVAAIAAGRELRVDVGHVNERIFLNNSSLGLYPRIVRHREHQQEKLGRGKWPALGWAVLSALHVFPSLHLRIHTADRMVSTAGPLLFVGNNVYRVDLFKIGGRDRLDQGVLCVYYARQTTRLGLLKNALQSLAGRLDQAEDFETLTATELRVETRYPVVRVAVDGETATMISPLEYRIRPRALRVIGPPS